MLLWFHGNKKYCHTQLVEDYTTAAEKEEGSFETAEEEEGSFEDPAEEEEGSFEAAEEEGRAQTVEGSFQVAEGSLKAAEGSLQAAAEAAEKEEDSFRAENYMQPVVAAEMKGNRAAAAE